MHIRIFSRAAMLAGAAALLVAQAPAPSGTATTAAPGVAVPPNPRTNVAPAAPASTTSSGAASASKTATPVPPPQPSPAGQPVLPDTVDSKYASLTAGRAREKTCSAQYHANKATGGNGGLKWSAYYKACSAKLKGLH